MALDRSDRGSERKVRVPWRRGDGIFAEDEEVNAVPEAAGQWDARQWHDGPAV